MSELILKVIAGPNEGACARLYQNEEVTIGRDLDCDVILSDQSVQSSHLRLVFDGQSIRLTALEGNVIYVDQHIREASAETGSVTCALFNPIKIASTIFIIGQGEESAWPTVDLEVFNSPVQSEGALHADGDSSQEQAKENSKLERSGLENEQDVHGLKRPQDTPHKRNRTKTMMIIAVLGVIAIIACVPFVLMGQTEQDQVVVSPEEKVTALLSQAGLERSVSFNFDQNDTLILSGFVKTSAEMVDLRYRLSDAGFSLRMNVDVLDLQVRSVKALLERMDVSWLAQGNAETGKIELQGYTPNDILQGQIISVLKRELPNLRPLEVRLMTAESIKEELEEAIAALKLSSSIETVVQSEQDIPRRLVVIGELGAIQKSKLEQALQTFKSTVYGTGSWGHVIKSQLGIRSQVTEKIEKPLAPPPLVIFEKKVKKVVAKKVPSARGISFSGVIYGDVALAIATSGRTYGVGDKLPNGYEISGISDKGIATRLGSKTKVYHIGKE